MCIYLLRDKGFESRYRENDRKIHRDHTRYVKNRFAHTLYQFGGKNFCTDAVKFQKIRFYNKTQTFQKQNSKIRIVKYTHNETKETGALWKTNPLPTIIQR